MIRFTASAMLVIALLFAGCVPLDALGMKVIRTFAEHVGQRESNVVCTPLDEKKRDAWRCTAFRDATDQSCPGGCAGASGTVHVVNGVPQ